MAQRVARALGRADAQAGSADHRGLRPEGTAGWDPPSGGRREGAGASSRPVKAERPEVPGTTRPAPAIWHLLHGEQIRERLRPDPERCEPRSDDDQHVPAPALDGGRARPDAVQRRLAGTDDQERGGEQEPHEDDGRYHEREEGGAEPPGRQPLPGQTGQDRTRSSEAGQQVPEPEQDQAGARMASAEARLRPDDGPGDPVAEAVEGEGKDLGLHETQQEEPGSYRDAEHAPGGARESHLTREAAAPERDECPNPEHEHHRPDRERDGHAEATYLRSSFPRALPGQERDEQRERARGEEGGDACHGGQYQQARPDAGRKIEAGKRHVAEIARESRQHEARGEQPVACPPASFVAGSQYGKLHAPERRGSSRR